MSPKVLLSDMYSIYAEAKPRKSLADKKGYVKSFLDFMRAHYPKIEYMHQVTITMARAYSNHLNTKVVGKTVNNKIRI